MSAPLEALAALYWEACRIMRRSGLAPGEEQPLSLVATAMDHLESQARRPAHPLIEAPCRRALADFGLDGAEDLRPCDTEPANGPGAA